MTRFPLYYQLLFFNLALAVLVLGECSKKRKFLGFVGMLRDMECPGNCDWTSSLNCSPLWRFDWLLAWGIFLKGL